MVWKALQSTCRVLEPGPVTFQMSYQVEFLSVIPHNHELRSIQLNYLILNSPRVVCVPIFFRMSWISFEIVSIQVSALVF
jgi:hypothetical protein